MKTSVSLYDFREAFRACGRAENFSHEGLEVLYNFLEEMEEACACYIELDVIAFCCDYSEDTPASIADDYSIDVSSCDDEEEVREAVLEYLQDNTIVCGETDTTIVYQQF